MNLNFTDRIATLTAISLIWLIFAFAIGMLVGAHAGKESIRRQMVHCEQMNTSNEPGMYMCLPVNQ